MEKDLRIRLLAIAFLLFVLFVATGGYFFRKIVLNESKSKAETISELVRDTLTSYMVMGVMDRRDEFLNRIKQVPGVERIKVIRGESVVKQFGAGMASEVPEDDLEKEVFIKGKAIEQLHENFEKITYRLVIPYKAESVKGINCLSCHRAKEGEVLGAISLTMDLSQIRSQSFNIFLLLSFVSGIVAFLGVYLLSRFIKPYVKLMDCISQCMDSAVRGNFKCRVQTEAGGEGKILADKVNHTFDYLDKTLKKIEEKVIAMLGYRILKTEDTISDTSKIVDELLRIYKFKRVIEQDRNKQDVYNRIISVFEDYMSLDKFSFYQVSKEKMEIVYVKGMDSWCNEIIFENAEECRAKRTGMPVDSREFVCICPNFANNQACALGKLNYYCIPVYVGGKVGNVFQIVYEPEMEEFIELLIPYLRGYLTESAPVLEARIYMDMLKEQSIVDALTGFYNRRFLEETIETITAQIRRRGTTLGILAVDVDFFKQVNDSHGHDVGDVVLKEVANTIKASIRTSDIPIRFGGEEFLVLLVDVQPGMSVEVAEKIRRAVESRTITANGITFKKTVSIGVSEYPTDSDKVWQCIKFADVALYRAKEGGRNRVVRFTPDMWTEQMY